MKKSIKSIISILICLSTILGAFALNIYAVDDAEEDVAVEEEAPEEEAPEVITDPFEYIYAVRLIKDVAPGEKIVKSAIQNVYIQRRSAPKSAVLNEAAAVGKYATVAMYAGDYVLTEKITDKRPDSGVSAENSDFLVVTDHIQLSSDLSDSIQQLIDENPNRTLYFPDGTYYFSKPIKTPSSPLKSVSFRLSNYAIFQANNWTGEKTDAIVQLGAKDKSAGETDSKVGTDYYFTGGIINCDSECSAISVAGSGNVLINNLSIKKSHYGIIINTQNVDVDNVVVIGTNTAESIGVLVNGSYNTLSNMRIFHINTGIKLTKGNNVLRTLHPLYAGSNKESCGFWDTSEGNYYDICYSDHFAVGFRMDSQTHSVYNGCFAYWYDAGGHYLHWGFASTGQFNSVIRNTRIDLNYDANVDSSYLVIGQSGGNGMVLYPICGGYRRDDHLSGWNNATYLKTNILH